jgi:hypothetical protein
MARHTWDGVGWNCPRQSEAISSKDVSDEELSAAIMAFEKCIAAMAKIPKGLTDCDEVALHAMRELQARRTAETHDEHCDVNDPIIKGKPCNCKNRVPVETSAESVSLDYQLPCDVRLPPAATIGKGCTLRTLMHALRLRESEPVEFVDERTMAIRRALTELHRPREGVTVSNKHEHATYVESPQKADAPRAAFVSQDRFENDDQSEGKPCGHARSELLAEKLTASLAPVFEMRKCLDCTKIFRVQSSPKTGADPAYCTEIVRSETHATDTGWTKTGFMVPANPPECPTCKTLLAFDGDVCGLCNPVAQP